MPAAVCIYTGMAKARIGQQGGELTAPGERRPAVGGGDASPAKHAAKKHAAKHAIKHAAKKHAAKHATKHVAEKHAAKKHAAKHAAKKHAASQQAKSSPAEVMEQSADEELAQAFHHLNRAGAIVSLLDTDTGHDLRTMLEDGIALYRRAAGRGADARIARCAAGLLRAAEHLGMAGLYAARGGYGKQVEAPPRLLIEEHLDRVQEKLAAVAEPEQRNGRRLLAMAHELLRHAGEAGDPHLEFELTMAADGLCTALEHGV